MTDVKNDADRVTDTPAIFVVVWWIISLVYYIGRFQYPIQSISPPSGAGNYSFTA